MRTLKGVSCVTTPLSVYYLAPLITALGLWPPIEPGTTRVLYRTAAIATLAEATLFRGCIPQIAVYSLILITVILRGIQELHICRHISWYSLVLGVITATLAWEWPRFAPFARPFGLSANWFAAICTTILIGFLADRGEVMRTWFISFIAINLLCLIFGQGADLLFTFWAIEAGVQGSLFIRRHILVTWGQKFDDGG